MEGETKADASRAITQDARMLYHRVLLRLSILLYVMLLVGCSSLPSQKSTEPNPSQGQALLFGLLEDESNVPKLLMIKRERAELRNLVREIGETTKKAHAAMEALARTNHVHLKDNGLPAAEIETRRSISKVRASELLKASGRDFELRLLLAQNEALTYAAHLAAIVAGSNTNQAGFYQQISNQMADLQKKVVGLLESGYKP
jgi:hypothetical protein